MGDRSRGCAGGVLAVVAALLLAAGCDRPAGEQTSAPPESEPGELTPTEVDVHVSPRPDGSVRVQQTMIFDAGESGRPEALVWTIGGARIGWYGENGERRTGQFWVDPKISDLSATTDGTPLPVTTDDSEADGTSTGYHRYELSPVQPWGPDRHRVSIDYVMTGVYVQHNGAPTVVVPLDFLHAGYGYTRLTVEGDPPLWCLADNIDATDQQPCTEAESGSMSWIGDHDNAIEAIGIRDPAGVETPAAEPLQRT